MPQIYKKQPKRIPKLQHHKASGRGVVRLKSKDFYCGDYGTQACEKEYNRLIAEYLAGNPMSVDRTGYTIAELLADYLDFARNYTAPRHKLDFFRTGTRASHLHDGGKTPVFRPNKKHPVTDGVRYITRTKVRPPGATTVVLKPASS